MNYAEAVAYIESLAPTILNPDLQRIADFLFELGNPQDTYPSIHVGGTNGKGSTVAIVDSVLRASGLNVGRFTGPHLLRWNERFYFNGKPIDDETFARMATELRQLSEDFGRRHAQRGHLTWFEFLTALAFLYFKEKNVDLAVFEVGLGGRWDATNVLHKPLVSAITTIDYDHTHILGPTLTDIAREKAGIIKPSVPIVTAAIAEALDEIKLKAETVGAPLYICAPPDFVSGAHPIDTKPFVQMKDSLALAATYQQLNGLISYAVLEIAGRELGKTFLPAMQEGFEKVYWPGRFQYLPSLHTVLDGAHNVGGARALRAALKRSFPNDKRLFVLSYFENKDVAGSLGELLGPGDRVFASQARTSRAVCSPDRIVDMAHGLGAHAQSFDSIEAAFAAAQQSRQNGELVVCTGSFATIKESMLAMGWHSVEDGIALTGLPQATPLLPKHTPGGIRNEPQV